MNRASTGLEYSDAAKLALADAVENGDTEGVAALMMLVVHQHGVVPQKPFGLGEFSKREFRRIALDQCGFEARVFSSRISCRKNLSDEEKRARMKEIEAGLAKAMQLAGVEAERVARIFRENSEIPMDSEPPEAQEKSNLPENTGKLEPNLPENKVAPIPITIPIPIPIPTPASELRARARESGQPVLSADNSAEAEVPCPAPDDEVAMKAHNLNLSQDELAAWRDYYAAQGWRFKPNSIKPMSKHEALRSLGTWKRAQARFDARDRSDQKKQPHKTALTAYKGADDDYANLPEL